jgi:HAAS domain-containing protein
MTTPSDQLDQLVVSYLEAVARELTGLPASRRAELLGDLRDHIAAERATLDPPTETGVRDILDRLGDPATLAYEARLAEDTPPPAPAPPPPAPPVWAPVPVPAPVQKRRGLGPVGWIAIALATMVLICFGVIAAGFAAIWVTPDGGAEPARPAESYAPAPGPS